MAMSPHRGTWRVSADSGRPPSVRGRVFDADVTTPAALYRAVVRVDTSRRDVFTDSLGRFQLDSLAPGRYSVFVGRVGYRPRREIVDVPHAHSMLIEVGLERQPLDGCPGFAAVVERRRVWRWPWQ